AKRPDRNGPLGHYARGSEGWEDEPAGQETTMANDYPDDDLIREMLSGTRTIAVVGASPNPLRPSNGVLRFLVAAGYEVYPINPGHAGKEIGGRTVHARLSDVPVPIDMVDVFRRSEAVGGVVDEVLRLEPLPKY